MEPCVYCDSTEHDYEHCPIYLFAETVPLPAAGETEGPTVYLSDQDPVGRSILDRRLRDDTRAARIERAFAGVRTRTPSPHNPVILEIQQLITGTHPNLALQTLTMAYDIPSALGVMAVITIGTLASWVASLTKAREANFAAVRKGPLKAATWFDPVKTDEVINWQASDDVPPEDEQLAALANEWANAQTMLENSSATLLVADSTIKGLEGKHSQAKKELIAAQEELAEALKKDAAKALQIADLERKLLQLEKTATPDQKLQLDSLRDDIIRLNNDLALAQTTTDRLARTIKASHRQTMKALRTDNPKMSAHMINQVLAALRARPAQPTNPEVPAPPESIVSDLTDDWGVGFADIPPRPPNDVDFPTVPAPNSDRFLELKQPFSYDGKPSKWNEWSVEIQMYVEGNLQRFREKVNVLNLFMTCTEPGSRAKRFVENLANSIKITGSDEHAAWHALTGVLQTSNWMLNKMAPVFRDHLTNMTALKNIMMLRQGTNYFSEYFVKLDSERMRLGWTTQVTLPHLLNGVNLLVRQAVAQRTGKLVEDLTWADFEKWGTAVDYDLRQAGQLKKESTPRALPGTAGPRQNNNRQQADQLKERKCGLKSSYEMSPAVPSAAQGRLYASPNDTPEQLAHAKQVNEYCRANKLCAACRRPRSAHPAGSRFMEVKEFRTFGQQRPPAALPAPISGPRVEDVTDQLALPAPSSGKHKTD